MSEERFGLDEAREHWKHVLLQWYEQARSIPDGVLPGPLRLELRTTLLNMASVLGQVTLPLEGPGQTEDRR